jgi:hypothetical protein
VWGLGSSTFWISLASAFWIIPMAAFSRFVVLNPNSSAQSPRHSGMHSCIDLAPMSKFTLLLHWSLHTPTCRTEHDLLCSSLCPIAWVNPSDDDESLPRASEMSWEGRVQGLGCQGFRV